MEGQDNRSQLTAVCSLLTSSGDCSKNKQVELHLKCMTEICRLLLKGTKYIYMTQHPPCLTDDASAHELLLSFSVLLTSDRELSLDCTL